MRLPRHLSHILFCYVEPENGEHARTHGKNLFGSFSAYVNALISKDRGVAPHLGHWKVPGQAFLEKEKKRVEKARKKSYRKAVTTRKRTMRKNKKEKLNFIPPPHFGRDNDGVYE